MAYNSGYWEELEGSLRKQLAEARAENAALVAEFQRLADEPPTLEEIAADLDKIEMLEKELAEARAEIERQTDRIMSDACIISAAALAIAERDKLIEQMREALKSASVVVSFYEANNDGAGRGIGKMIDAALSAAERINK